MAHLKSVPYKVSLRWLFYRLLDEGVYTQKNDYINKFKSLMSKARHNNWDRWKPDSIEDDTRQIYWKGIGSFTESDAIKQIQCNYDKFQDQENIVLILFEARAMHDQFSYYTKNIPLIPLGGDPSIPLKYDIASSIDWLSDRYDKPIKLVYFGDYDLKGKQIRETTLDHIQKWCNSRYDVIIGGLTLDQVTELSIKQDPDKPGYQWESLTDQQADILINRSILPIFDQRKALRWQRQQAHVTKKWRKLLSDAINEK